MNWDKILEDLQARVRNQRRNYEKVAEISGLSRSLVTKFALGQKDNPTFRTMRALDRACAEMEKDAA